MDHVNFKQVDLQKLLKLRKHAPVSNWFNGREEIPDKHLVHIFRRFPELNANWVVNGSGDMLNAQPKHYNVNETEKSVITEHTSPYNLECTNPKCVTEISLLRELSDSRERHIRDLEDRIAELLRKENRHNPGENEGGVGEYSKTG